MDQQYITPLLEAYKKGYEAKYSGREERPDLKYHYFKAKEDLPRVEVVIGFLRGAIHSGQCRSLLDIGSGRGVFLFPLLREFSNLDVTSLDVLPHRIELLECIAMGGVPNLHPILGDICKCELPSKSFDVVTALEVLEHIPDTQTAVKNIVRLAKRYVIVSVPSKEDDNPEHIHLFSNEDLERIFKEAGCTKVKFMSVTNHRVMVAFLNSTADETR